MGFLLIPLSEASYTRMHTHTHTHSLFLSVTHTRLHAHNTTHTHTISLCHTHTHDCTHNTTHTHTHVHTTCPHNQNSSCTLTLWPSSHIRYCCTHNCSFYNTSQLLQTSHIICQHIPSSAYVQSLLNTNYVCTWQKYTSTVHFLHNNAYVKTKNRTNGFAYT